jgi:hypothetical protein
MRAKASIAVLSAAGMIRVMAALVVTAAFCWSAGDAHAYGARYWLHGGKEIQLVGLNVHTSAQAPDVKICALYLGTMKEWQDGKKPLVEFSDLLFEQFLGSLCYDNGISHVTVIAGPWIVISPGEPAVGRGSIQSGRAWMQKKIDQGLMADSEFRVDYSASKPGVYERLSHLDVPVLPSPFTQNAVPVPTQIAPGVTIGLEGVFDLNPDNARQPFTVLLYQTEVPLSDAAASDALGKQVIRSLARDRIDAREIRGAMAVAHNERKLGRFHIRPRRAFRAELGELGLELGIKLD